MNDKLQIRVTKICNICNIEKDLTEFYKHPSCKDGYRLQCKDCHNAMHTQRYTANPDVLADLRYKAKYNITIEDYNDMFIEQGGRCAICGKHQKDLKNKLAVDHCHGTKKVRGLLCLNCNTALGNFRDRLDLLENAMKYLEFSKEKENER
jgi:hypothetical protein